LVIKLVFTPHPGPLPQGEREKSEAALSPKEESENNRGAMAAPQPSTSKRMPCASGSSLE
jgi:hypothetical protein